MRYGLAYGEQTDRIVPQAFYYLIGDRTEAWEEEIHVYHNPNAKYPLPDGAFGKAIDIRFDDGDYYHVLKGFHALSSMSYPIHVQKERRQEMETTLRTAGVKFVDGVKAQEEFIADKMREIYKR